MQRIGRSGHTIGEASGIIVPKFRGDLVARAVTERCTTRRSRARDIRAIRWTSSRNRSSRWCRPNSGRWTTFSTLCAAPLRSPSSAGVFEGVLDMLSGRYPSDDFADLRPRLTWDRIDNVVTARDGAKRIAVTNGGTIPDRGLYGVFLVGQHARARASASSTKRWCSRAASARRSARRPSWRIEQISHDRVLVSAAPGEPGRSGRPIASAGRWARTRGRRAGAHARGHAAGNGD